MARTSAFVAIVTSVSGQNVTLSLDDGGEDTVMKLRHVSCAPGDLAHVSTVGRARFVDGVVGAGAAPVPDDPIEVPPPAPDAIDSGSWVFGPTDPGSWRDGTWREDTTLLYQGVYGSGSPQYGAAWYGDGPSSLPGDLTGASLTLLRVEGTWLLLAPTIALYAGTSRGSAPVVLDSEPGPTLELDVPVVWDLPSDWLPLLQSGAAGGLGCYLPSEDPALALSAEGQGMTLTCDWED